MDALRLRAPLTWRTATVREVVPETPEAVTIVLDVPDWPGHRAGQHVDVRLTAEDGYQAQRSYSIASAPELDALELTVERIEDGEVSPYLADELLAGDPLELRGPIGGHFTWSADQGGPLLLVGGGSGVVPLMAMLRHRAARASTADCTVLLSARSEADALYRDELDRLEPREGLRVHRTYTRTPPPGWTGWSRRVDAAMLEAVAASPGGRRSGEFAASPGGRRSGEFDVATRRVPAAGELAAGLSAAELKTFVCGPTPFVEAVADALTGLGHDPGAIHTERFGPTGG